MRVLVLTHRLPYAPNRGDRIRAFHLVHELARRAEVDLVSLTHDAQEESHTADLLGVVARLATARVPRARNLLRGIAALPTSRPLTHILLNAPGLGATLTQWVAVRPPSVVLAYCSGMARFALEEPLRSLPSIVDLVDVDSEKWGELALTARPPRRWIYARERRCLARFEITSARHARATLVVNERERASLIRLAPDANVHVLPNGIDLAAFHPDGPPAGSSMVIFCGVMNYEPNEQAAMWLARAVWPLVRQARPDARLLLAGANPTKAVRSLAGEDASIEVTGTVPDVRPHLHRAAIAAAPLQVARGVQNKVLEAVASGLPSVVTPMVFAGLPAQVAPACVVADSPQAFAAAILDLLARAPAERRTMAARADLAALGWREQLAPLVDILQNAIKTRPGQASQ